MNFPVGFTLILYVHYSVKTNQNVNDQREFQYAKTYSCVNEVVIENALPKLNVRGFTSQKLSKNFTLFLIELLTLFL